MAGECRRRRGQRTVDDLDRMSMVAGPGYCGLVVDFPFPLPVYLNRVGYL
jgi:hypothetical protein